MSAAGNSHRRLPPAPEARKGWRGDTDMNERLRSDVDYIRHGSFVMDIIIMARTLINRENAY